MTIAGLWQGTASAIAVEIEGSEANYSFRNFLMGNAVAQGVATRDGRNPNVYVFTGQGIGGPVNMTLQLQGPDQGLLTITPKVGIPLFDQFIGPLGTERHILVRTRKPVEASEQTARAIEQQPEPQPEPKKKRIARKPDDAERRKAANGGNPLDALDEMIGMAAVKDQLRKLDAWAWRQRELKEKGVDVESPTLHMSFAGNPGTGKTTVAKIIGRLLHRYGLIDREEVIEKGRADLVGKFVGHTAEQTKKAIEEAVGGVLFIDEAYALSEPGKGTPQDYGAEALTVLVAEMENRRHELCVVVAGYPAEMDGFLDANSGLASRISRRIVFPDFTDDELCRVFEQMIRVQGLTRDEGIVPLLRRYTERARTSLPPRRWGNARSIRNILQAAVENQALRLRAVKGSANRNELLRLTAADFEFLKDSSIPVY